MRKFIAIILLLAGLSIAGFIIYQNSFQILNLQFKNNSSGLIVDVYTYSGDNDNNTLSASDRVAENITATTSVKLKRGGYRVVSRSNPSYKQFDQQLYLGENPQTIMVDTELSESRLVGLLGSERTSINSVTLAMYPTINTLYSIEKEQLFNKGDWYSALLTYKGFDYLNDDKLLLVAHKTNGEWKIITRPPEQIVSTKKYPSIPKNVVVETNKKVL
jgi:hypothetical protein